ncbi:EAL domain-containing protein [Thiobaca trueperi]|uniref:EAL domain-containing protein n=1 Tax=Thiobaca trueperi TaxID=127458 RepID=UPI001FB492AC|nr:EAL domain-containing protein [Thiobaca trueperi]
MTVPTLPPVLNLESMPLLAAMPMGALVLDDRQGILATNQAFLDLLGYSPGQVVGRVFDDLTLTDHADALTGLLESSHGECLRLDVRFANRRGGDLMASVAFSRFVAPGQSAPRLLAMIVRHAESCADPRQETRADEAQAFAQVGTWELDLATGQVLTSRNWYDIWGFCPERPVTLDRCLQRIDSRDRDQVIAALARLSETESSFQLRFRIQRPDGRMRWLESTGRLEPDGAGLAGRLYGSVLDITSRCEAEQALARYADIVSASPDRIAFVDRGCWIKAANAAFLDAVGRANEQVIDHSFRDICGDGELPDLLYRHLSRCLDHGQSVIDDIRETHHNGDMREAEVRLFPHRDDQGSVTGIVIYIRDVTVIREAQRRLLQSAAVYAATSEGVLITDGAGVIVAVNAAFTRITGYAESDVLGRKPNILNSQWHSPAFFVGMWRRVLRHGSWQGEIWNRRKDGEIYRQKLTIRRVQDARGTLINLVGVFAEPGVTMGAPRRAEHLLHYDALTKLPNRLLFESRLEHALELCHRHEAPLALFLVDLDRFSHLNASLGHQIGDELLRVVALRLREAIRPADTLARLRADQFGLLFEAISQAEEASEIARRLHATLRAPIRARGHEVFVTASIGVAVEIGLKADRNAMIAQAEAALRQVKRQGRNAFRMTVIESADAADEHRHLLELLRTGLKKNEYRLLYRPQVDLETGICQGGEACIHWESSELGPVPAERFLPLANESGFIYELGHWALATACRQLQVWLSQGLPVCSLAIPVAEAQVMRGDLLPVLERLLIAHPAAATLLELGFSELLLQKHPEQIAQVFNGLHRMGIGIALNDAGSGWVAPAVLRRLPVRVVTIHSSFIESLPDSSDDLAVVQAIIAMAQALDLDIRADGVRTDPQRLLLLNIGCRQAQGDLFGGPLPAAQIERRFGAPPEPVPQPAFEN